MQCPKCGSHREHIYTFETSPKTGKQWAVERCPHCQFGFDCTLYSDYLKSRTEKRHTGRDVRDDVNKWKFGL